MRKLGRFFVRSFVMIVPLAALTIGWRFYVREPILSVWWHATHGNSVMFGGRSMNLPVMWRVDESDLRPGLHLTRAVFAHYPSLGRMYSGVLNISVDPAHPEVVDDAKALDWQTEEIAQLNSRRPATNARALSVRTRSLNFYCVESGETPDPSDFFFCKAGRTNWLAIAGEGAQIGPHETQKVLGEAKGILESMK